MTNKAYSLHERLNRLGVDALLINPMNKRLKGMLLASNVVLGKDRHCRKYSRAVRAEQI